MGKNWDRDRREFRRKRRAEVRTMWDLLVRLTSTEPSLEAAETLKRARTLLDETDPKQRWRTGSEL